MNAETLQKNATRLQYTKPFYNPFFVVTTYIYSKNQVVLRVMRGLETMEKTNYKCHNCFSVIGESMVVYEDKKIPLCPDCRTPVDKMCAHDRICTCVFEISSGTHSCPICGEPICPCGSHSVFQISRVTGYLANLSSFNKGKQAEWEDRKRYNIAVQ